MTSLNNMQGAVATCCPQCGLKKLYKLGDNKKFSILKKGIGIDRTTYTSVKSLDFKKVWKQVKVKKA